MLDRSMAPADGRVVVAVSGGPDSNDMCAGCHLKPGRSASDLSQGLYPQPPNLTLVAVVHDHGDHGNAEDTAAARTIATTDFIPASRSGSVLK